MRRIIIIIGEPVYSGEDDYAVVERTIIGEPVYSGEPVTAVMPAILFDAIYNTQW